MTLPKWYVEQSQTKRRKTPLAILAALIFIAIAVKVILYANQYNDNLGPPILPSTDLPNIFGNGGFSHDNDQNNDHDDDHDEDDSYTAVNTAPTPSYDHHPTTTDPSTHETITPILRPPPDHPHRRPRPTINPWHTFRTEIFAAPNITFTFNGTTAPGYFFVAPRSLVHRMSAPMILDEKGDLVWRGPTGESTNMKVQLIDGKPHLTYWRSMRNFIIGHEYGSVHILNSSYDEVYKVCPPDMNIVTNDMHHYECVLDMHVLTITDRGTLLATAYNISHADLTAINGTEHDWVYDSQFYEIDIKTQEILFSWRSVDHIDQLPIEDSKLPLRRRPGEPNISFRSHPYDYFHINAVEVLDDGYLVNARNMWNIFKIDKSGHVEWRLNGEDGGDFTLDGDLFFSWEHDARVINRTEDGLYISIFNNDFNFVTSAVNVSDALVLYVDLKSRHASVSRTLKDEVEHIYSLAMGNHQTLPDGHVFVNYGFGGTFKEYNEDDEVVMTGHFGRGSNRSFYSTYNMYRIDNWHGEPSEPPKVYAEYLEETNETTVWMSWNGATDYDEWKIYAGHEFGKLSVVAENLERTGFETELALEGLWEWAQVEAWQGSSAMRNSTGVETHIWKPPPEYDGEDKYYYYDDPKNPSDHGDKAKERPTHTRKVPHASKKPKRPPHDAAMS